MPPASVLAAAHRRAQQQVQADLEAYLDALVQAMPDLSETSLGQYAAAAAARTAAAQTYSAQLGAGYTLTLLGAETPARRGRRAIDLVRALEPVKVDVNSPVAVGPTLRARRLEPDLGLDAAQAEAGRYAAALGSGDVQAAQRVGLDEGARASGVRINGWTKELGPTACPWCELTASERVYGSAANVPFHDNDRCSVAPVTD